MKSKNFCTIEEAEKVNGVVAKYGWSATLNGDAIHILNRRGYHALTITKRNDGKRYRFYTGEFLLYSGNVDMAAAAGKFLEEYFFCEVQESGTD